jgi:hypothetical protein
VRARELYTEIESLQARVQLVDLFQTGGNQPLRKGSQAELEIVNLLRTAIDSSMYEGCGAFQSTLLKASGAHEQLVSHVAREPLLEYADLVQQAFPCADYQFGSGGRSGRAEVRNKIGNCEVGLMADRGNDRDA